jgi:hypothetical protein
MKKLIFLFIAVCLFSGNSLNAQVGRLLNKVSKSVTNEVSGNPATSSNNTKQEPEPKCACGQPDLIFDLGGKLKLMYSEISISTKDDGSILVKDKISSDYYIIKEGATEGPIKAGDLRLAGFDNVDDRDKPKETTLWANNEYISKSGEKYLIKFKGKTYGPYGEIREFEVTKSKEKFAAFVIENVLNTEADAKKMEEAIKNAKTDQEKMELSMKYSQQMMQKMQQGGGPTSILPKLITNIEGVDYAALESVGGGNLNGNIKYDDILLTSYDKITDLKGKLVLTLKPEAVGVRDLFVNTNNTKYAVYNYGTLTFSDNTVMSDMFNLRWVKVNGQVSLAYMYYSPKRNAIMQCKMAF